MNIRIEYKKCLVIKDNNIVIGDTLQKAQEQCSCCLYVAEISRLTFL